MSFKETVNHFFPEKAIPSQTCLRNWWWKTVLPYLFCHRASCAFTVIPQWHHTAFPVWAFMKHNGIPQSEEGLFPWLWDSRSAARLLFSQCHLPGLQEGNISVPSLVINLIIQSVRPAFASPTARVINL